MSLSESAKTTTRDVLGIWETRLRDGSANRERFIVWIQSMMGKFSTSESELRALIQERPYLMDVLGGVIPSYNRRPPKRKGGCCGG